MYRRLWRFWEAGVFVMAQLVCYSSENDWDRMMMIEEAGVEHDECCEKSSKDEEISCLAAVRDYDRHCGCVLYADVMLEWTCVTSGEDGREDNI